MACRQKVIISIHVRLQVFLAKWPQGKQTFVASVSMQKFTRFLDSTGEYCSFPAEISRFCVACKQIFTPAFAFIMLLEKKETEAD